MGSKWNIIGIEDSDGFPCECCGTPCPKRRVVMSNEDGDIRRLGSTCAGYVLVGRRAATPVNQWEKARSAAEYQAKLARQNEIDRRIMSHPRWIAAVRAGIVGVDRVRIYRELAETA